MSENCNNKQALQRDGTSQPQRVLQALLPDYVAVDERSMSDLIAFTQKLNTEIRFYNLADAIDGDWTGFFDKIISEEQRTEAHYALFIAFLELFAIAQKDMNTITKRHLDYYYREVLNLHERPAVPDQVFILFELAEQLSSSLVAQGTALDAKKDATGVDLVYDTDKDIVVNQSKVDQLKAVFVNKPFDLTSNPLVFPDEIPAPELDPDTNTFPLHVPETGNDWRIYASPVANSSDGIGGDIDGDEKRWRTFGMPHQDDDDLADRPEGEAGFAFASPLLFLAEGTREVKITLNFSPPVAQNNSTTSNDTAFGSLAVDTMFETLPIAKGTGSKGNPQSPPPPTTPPDIPLNIFFSGEKEWIIPEFFAAPYFTANDASLVLTCTIGKGQKGIVAYDESVLLQPFKTQWPVVKITLNTDSDQWANYFNRLSSKVLYTTDIEVNVSEVRTVVLQNDDSVLSADKPFVPFTNRPVPGSSFYVGSTEIFQKQLSSLKLNITWDALPDPAIYHNGFADYYKYYLPIDEANKRSNTKFKVKANLLYKKSWSLTNDTTDYSLFDVYRYDSSAGEYVSDDFRVISLSNNLLSAVPRDPFMDAVNEFGTTTKRGFLRLTLESPDFGHSIYQNSFAQQAIWKTIPSTIPAGYDTNRVGLPPDPYTPTIKEVYVDYTSKQSLDMRRGFHLDDEANYNNRIDQFFHVMPFGVAEQHPHIVKTVQDIPVMPQFTEEGELYIGISNLEAPEIVSVLMKVAEGSENPDYEKQPVNWSYMSNNEWFRFDPVQVLTDTTNGLLTSGIVTFDVPKAITSTNTALPTGLSWLRASVTKETAAICDMIDIKAQAVTATFVNNGNDPDHLRTPLPAETIKGLVESDAAIDKVTQPYASFGGKVEEQSTDFYVRVSERLRHKQRAITIWDYEHLVLEHFPAVYKVKCLNHTRYISANDIHELKPGHVSLVIISNLHNKNAVDPLKPRTSLVTLDAIHDFVVALNPPCAELHVKNPIFEEIQVNFNVRFLPGYDNGFYGKKLNEELKQFLAPWAYDGKDIVFGGVIHKSVILNFVEDRPYVDFVTCFNMDQIIQGLPNTAPLILKNVEEAVTTTSASVLTSAAKHTVNVLENDDCSCDDNEIIQPTLSVPEPCPECGEKELSVADGISEDAIGSTFVVGHPRRQGVDFWAIEEDFKVQ